MIIVNIINNQDDTIIFNKIFNEQMDPAEL